MKKRRTLVTLFVFLMCKLTSLSADYTLEELNQMRDLQLITKEDYEVLKAEILQNSSLTDNMYSLKINGKRLSNTYKVINKEGRAYLEILEFF